MAFLAPVALVGLLLVSLPLLIHLLVRRRGQRLDFPSLRFLRETPSFKLFPRRIRQPLLLALRAAAIILLVLGLARPLFTSSSQTPEAVRFILIDASLSMKTRGRAEAAREQARAIINKLKSGERASVIALSSEAMVLEELTADKGRLLEAVGRYQPTGGSLDYSAGFASIRTKLQSEPQVSVQADIISDFQQSGLEESVGSISRETAQLRIVTYPVGSEIERNASLIDEAVGKSKRGVELSASEIVSEMDGQSGERRVWPIDASEGTRPGIEWRTQASGQIAGRLEVLGPDEFDADDERFFAFMPPRENRILLIEDGTDASLYLRAALEAGKEGATNFSLDTRRNLPESEADLTSFSLVVVTLRGAAREDEMRALTEYARAGGNVWLCMGRDVDAASWSQLAGEDAGRELPFASVARRSSEQPLHFGVMDADVPQLRELDEGALDALGAVRARESYVVTPRASADTLMRWNDGTPAFISSRAGKGTIMLLATSTERASSELGLSPAFPALVSSILRATQFAREPLSQTIGEAVRLNVAPETEVKITGAEGRVTMTKARELIRRPLAYFSEPGIYQLEFADQQKLLAFNAPAIESERALAAGDELKQYFSTDKTESARAINASDSREALERSGSTWRYFLCAAFLLIIAELFVAMRQRKSVEVASE
jgi:Aerotolerance regulator N-terminal/von Willebrand factor type A domain